MAPRSPIHTCLALFVLFGSDVGAGEGLGLEVVGGKELLDGGSEAAFVA